MRQVGCAPLQSPAQPLHVASVQLGLAPPQQLWLPRPLPRPRGLGPGLLALVEEVAGLGQTVGVRQTQREVEPGPGALLLLSVEVGQVEEARGVTWQQNMSIRNYFSRAGALPESQSSRG